MGFFSEMLMDRLPKDGMDMRLDRINVATERLGQTTTGFIGGGLGPHVGADVSPPRCLDILAFRSDCAVGWCSLSLYCD